MENYQNIYNSICRLCLSYSNSKKMISLIDKNSQDGLTVYAKAVSTFAQINFTKEDCFPSKMCLKCLCLLKQAIHFKFVTESSDNCLRNLKSSVISDGEDLKEKIIEFAMLKFYLPTECMNTTQKGFKMKKNLKEDIEMHKTMGKGRKSDQLRSSNIADYEFFDNPMLESENEQEMSQYKILDKIDNNAISSNIAQPLTMQNVLNSNKREAERKSLREQYKQEMKRNRGQKKNLACKFCNKVLANRITFDHHMQRHIGCRYICEHCGKGFPILNELQMHQVTRHGTGPSLQCSRCPFKAPRKFDLIEHERIHSGERPYTCDKCGLTFRRRGIWKKHLIYHTDKNIQCPQCPRKFYLRSAMLAHANNIHDRMYVYLCSHCGVTYTKTGTVRRHMTERHGIPKELQGKIIRVNKGSSNVKQ